MPQPLLPEDYVEPQCPFCTDAYTEKPAGRVPIDRILQRLDEYLAQNDGASAERHLQYWLQEAVAGGDDRGRLFLCNELMGFYRRRGDCRALQYAECALALVEKIGLGDTVTAATTQLNAATVAKAFARPNRAVELYEQARAIYVKRLPETDERLGGLYNNLGLALCDLSRYDEAESCYTKALEIMRNFPAEQAVTLLNQADAAAARLGAEAAEAIVNTKLSAALEKLNMPQPQNGNYADVCEKCAAVFDYYGWFADAAELTARARRIYDGN